MNVLFAKNPAGTQIVLHYVYDPKVHYMANKVTKIVKPS